MGVVILFRLVIGTLSTLGSVPVAYRLFFGHQDRKVARVQA